MVALSIMMLLVYGGGLFNEIQVFNAIQMDEDEGHEYSSQGMIVVALYLLSIACEFNKKLKSNFKSTSQSWSLCPSSRLLSWR